MIKVDPQDSENSEQKSKNEELKHKLLVERFTQSLVHAYQCSDNNCCRPNCEEQKQCLSHFKSCKQRSHCTHCKKLTEPCQYHAKYCQEAKCLVPLCHIYKQKLHVGQMQTRMQQNHLMRRRMAIMNQDTASASASGSTCAQSPGTSSATDTNKPPQQKQPHGGGARRGKDATITPPPPGAMQTVHRVPMVAQRQSPMAAAAATQKQLSSIPQAAAKNISQGLHELHQITNQNLNNGEVLKVMKKHPHLMEAFVKQVFYKPSEQFTT